MINIFELSIQDGRPYETYEFSRDVSGWYYTTRSKAHQVGLQSFEPEKISRSSLEYTSELNKTNVKIRVPRDNAVASLFVQAPPGNLVNCQITRRHVGADAPEDQEVLWRGRIVAVDWQSRIAEMTGEPVFTSLRRTGLRRHYSRACPHQHYGPACKVDRAPFTHSTTVQGLTGSVLTLADLGGRPDGWYAGGYCQYHDDEGAMHYQMVVEHTGNDITLAPPPIGLSSGMAVEVLAGCNRTTQTCFDKFNNIAHYGGMPYLPTLNPFEGATIF